MQGFFQIFFAAAVIAARKPACCGVRACRKDVRTVGVDSESHLSFVRMFARLAGFEKLQIEDYRWSGKS